MMKNQVKLWAVISVILCIITYDISCAGNHFNQDKRENSMENSDFVLNEAISRCKQGNQSDLARLYADLNREDFLISLDGQEIYSQQQNPPNLWKLLRCLARQATATMGSDNFVNLANSQLYSRDNPDGALRRALLIQACGHMDSASSALIDVLTKEIRQGDYFEALASRALARMGTKDSLEALWRNIFDPKTTVIPEFSRKIVWTNYTYEIGERRDKPPVLSFLLDRLYLTDARDAAVRCITDDLIDRGSDPQQFISLAPLNKQTPHGIELAHTLSAWIIANGVDLKEFEDFTAITRRLPDLLGIKPTEPASGEPVEVKRWTIEQFERALKVESDHQRQKEIQEVLNALK